MNGNIWEVICEHLNIEPDEPFKLSFVDEKDYFWERYKIKTYGKDAGLYVDLFGNNNWVKSTLYLNKLLGFGTIAIQEPWKPKSGESYWTVLWTVDNNNKAELEVSQTYYALICSTDQLRVGLGNCFKTEKQAENNKFKVFERLVGKTWEEWCKENGYKPVKAD